jgi:3,4-dihydroxy 2-butanone 4-phosphate synthase/GTP cyclohydrolase II
MLADLGVQSVVLMSNNPDKQKQLEDNGITVTKRVPHVIGINEDNRDYMRTKGERMGHVLEIQLKN